MKLPSGHPSFYAVNQPVKPSAGQTFNRPAELAFGGGNDANAHPDRFVSGFGGDSRLALREEGDSVYEQGANKAAQRAPLLATQPQSKQSINAYYRQKRDAKANELGFPSYQAMLNDKARQQGYTSYRTMRKKIKNAEAKASKDVSALSRAPFPSHPVSAISRPAPQPTSLSRMMMYFKQSGGLLDPQASTAQHERLLQVMESKLHQTSNPQAARALIEEYQFALDAQRLTEAISEHLKSNQGNPGNK